MTSSVILIDKIKKQKSYLFRQKILNKQFKCKPLLKTSVFLKKKSAIVAAISTPLFRFHRSISFVFLDVCVYLV